MWGKYFHIMTSPCQSAAVFRKIFAPFNVIMSFDHRNVFVIIETKRLWDIICDFVVIIVFVDGCLKTAGLVMAKSIIYWASYKRLILTSPNTKSLQWHYLERDGISNHRCLDCLFNRLFRHRSKKTSKLHVTGLCEGNPPVTSEFSSQRACNMENVLPFDEVIMVGWCFGNFSNWLNTTQFWLDLCWMTFFDISLMRNCHWVK